MCVLPNYPYISNTFRIYRVHANRRGKMKRIKPAPSFRWVEQPSNFPTNEPWVKYAGCTMSIVTPSGNGWKDTTSGNQNGTSQQTDEMYDLYVNQHISYRGSLKCMAWAVTSWAHGWKRMVLPPDRLERIQTSGTMLSLQCRRNWQKHSTSDQTPILF